MRTGKEDMAKFRLKSGKDREGYRELGDRSFSFRYTKADGKEHTEIWDKQFGLEHEVPEGAPADRLRQVIQEAGTNAIIEEVKSAKEIRAELAEALELAKAAEAKEAAEAAEAKKLTPAGAGAKPGAPK
jgi:hypothetical protein